MTLHSYPTTPFFRRIGRMAVGALLLAGLASGVLAERPTAPSP
jgi:lipopolysaccharide export system protein LptA